MSQSAGAAASGGAAALFSREAMDGIAAGGRQNRRLEVRMGYGLPVFGYRFTGTPELALGLSDRGRDLGLGWRLAAGAGAPGGPFELRVEARRRESANDNTPPAHELSVGFTARW